MRLPSIRQAYQEAQSTFRRFPVVLCDAALATAAALILVDYEGPAQPSILFNIFFAGLLGIPLLIALALMGERKKLSTPTRLGLQLAGVLVLAGYAFTIPTDFTHAPLVTLIRFFILAVALHLMVSVAPFVTRGEWNGFWQYNKGLFLRILTTLLYALILYAGLSLAVAAIDILFDVYVPGKRYFELWILISGLFSTWFFLAGIPEDLDQLDSLTEYPKSLKVLAQYILLPIVLLYLVILYAYLGKIIIAWDWPQGWVSKLILGFSGTGMFLLLLLHPIMGHAESVWLRKFSQWFYIVLMPLIVMLFLALWRRVGEYGITEGRYLAFALGVWMIFLVVYFSMSITKSIKVIPASLCVLAFAVSFGPWGVFSVSRESQKGRLERFATEAGLLVGTKIMPARGELPFEQAKQISSLLSYMHEVHGYQSIQDWFDESLKESSGSSDVAYKSPEAVARMMGFEYVSHWAASPEGIVTFEAEGPFDPQGYNRMTTLHAFWRAGDKVTFASDGVSYHVSDGLESILFSAVGSDKELVRIDLLRHAGGLLERHRTSPADRIPNDAMVISAEGNGLRVKICPSRIEVQENDGNRRISSITAIILYSLDRSASGSGQRRDPVDGSQH